MNAHPSASPTALLVRDDLPDLDCLRAVGLAWFSLFIDLGALIGITTVILVLLYGQSRIFFVMARDGLLPGFLSKIHPKWKTPHIVTMITGSPTVRFSLPRACTIARRSPVDNCSKISTALSRVPKRSAALPTTPPTTAPPGATARATAGRRSGCGC